MSKKHRNQYRGTELAGDQPGEATGLTHGVTVRLPSPGEVVRDPKVSIAEQLAQSHVCMHNVNWKGNEKDYPARPWLRTIELQFPFSPQGALHVDTYRADEEGEAELYAEKTRLVRAHGLRYVAISSTMSLHEALVALGEAPGGLTHVVGHIPGRAAHASLG